jgi:hypothetical protein
MKIFTVKVDILFIVLFIGLLSFFTILRIRDNYHILPLASINKNLTLVRSSIDDFYDLYNRYPTEAEIQGLDNDETFFTILNYNLNTGFKFLNKIEFPETPQYTKKIDGVFVEIGASDTIKICNKLENLGLDNSIYSSNGGWIYSPINGEFRANLQKSSARNKLTDSSRPIWGNEIDWYYK